MAREVRVEKAWVCLGFLDFGIKSLQNSYRFRVRQSGFSPALTHVLVLLKLLGAVAHSALRPQRAEVWQFGLGPRVALHAQRLEAVPGQLALGFAKLGVETGVFDDFVTEIARVVLEIARPEWNRLLGVACILEAVLVLFSVMVDDGQRATVFGHQNNLQFL